MENEIGLTNALTDLVPRRPKLALGCGNKYHPKFKNEENNNSMATILWTDYLRYRAKLRGFDLSRIEEILRYTEERYFDTVTHRLVAVGKHGKILVMIPYDRNENNVITPITIHATNRQQINYRFKSGRYKK